jgi:hypothetical protein
MIRPIDPPRFDFNSQPYRVPMSIDDAMKTPWTLKVCGIALTVAVIASQLPRRQGVDGH